MLLEQFHLESLGHASYLVGDTDTGDALVLDPRRDVDVYLAAARDEGLRIRHVIDTHQHNDYLSGIRELAERTGARALGSAEAVLGYDHDRVKDGQEIRLGEIGLRVLHTPGHTPEHVSLLVFDPEHSADEPAALLSGGALLVGDLARPDLLGGEDETREAARTYCRTIQERILELPDHVLVYPTHVAGSLCGGSIGQRLVTTVGYERRTNAILSRVSTKDEFVEECLRLDDLPAVPPYWRRMRARNQEGPAPLGVVDPPPALTAEQVDAAIGDGEIVLDVRPPEAFAGGHIPGAISVGLSPLFPTWAGTVLPEGARVVLVTEEPAALEEATWGLLRIGYERPLGFLAGGMRSWRVDARPLRFLGQATVQELAERHDQVEVLDVRQPGEWAAGHAPGARFITGAEICDRIDEVPRDREVVVTCGSGYRSTVVASVLLRAGHDRVRNLLGGMGAWSAADLPTEGTG